MDAGTDCTRKKSYPDAADAWAAVARLRSLGQKGLRAYKCRLKGDGPHYHVGRPKRWRRA